MGEAAEGHEPDALHTASLSTGPLAAVAPPVKPILPRRHLPMLLRIRPAPCLPPHLTAMCAALLVTLMIIWSTLGHRFAASTRFAGDGSTACLLGLVVGLLMVVARKLFHPGVLQSMLSFDPANFFV